ncbi:membrane-associated protein, putative [Bodo saltans]|uniref:Membrane-associated protein, putative n=1 Tax=Bodo saltans TaxID=75058 RepID=A0A0S4J9R5_BODSA|nr:membrane-associated protein, putative [Bodo saltans]|eukprot:CUG85809.1 membrane-associated protein, putative [Bodo saltans]
MCVPVVLVLRWRLRLLRRPPSNPLVLLNNVTVVGVLLATLVFVEGPASSQSAAASVRDVLGYVLTVVSVVNTVLTIVSVVAEGYAKRSHQTSLHKVKEQVNGELQSQTNVLYWLSEAADSQEFSEPQAADRCALQLACVAASPALVLSAGSSLYYRTPPRRSLNTAALDAQIDHLLQHSLYAPLVQHCPSEHDPVAYMHQHLQQQKQWNRAQQFTLKLLITRAARNAKFFDAWKPWDQEMGRDK